MVQACRRGALPVADGIIARVQRFVRRHTGHCQGALKDPGVWFVGADFAGDDDVLEELVHAEIRKDAAQSPVKVGNDRQPESRTEGLEKLAHFREEFPDARLGELSV